ncbi:MAG TPA: hypothetical protein VGG64_17410 [Pirellulales bacterium]|jgi:hypothetical protein
MVAERDTGCEIIDRDGVYFWGTQSPGFAAHVRKMKRGRRKMLDGIYLGPVGASSEKFAELFRSTWKQIPRRHRGLLREHWRSVPIAQYWAPEIQIGIWENCEYRTLGVCQNKGRRFVFLPEAIDKFPDENVRELIAHELAHAVQHASGWFDYRVPDGMPRNLDRNEAEADMLMAYWGFKPDALDDCFGLLSER